MKIKIITILFLSGYVFSVFSTTNWRLLELADTLDVFLGEQKVGWLTSSYDVDKKAKNIKETTLMFVNQPSVVKGEKNFLELKQDRFYNFEGVMIEASQQIKSPSGINRWTLRRKQKKWVLEIEVGSSLSVVSVDSVTETLESIYKIYDGILRGTIQIGDSWTASAFELISARNFIITTRCIEIPSSSNGFTYTFISTDNLSGRDERWVIGTDRRTRLREISGMFVAKAPNYGFPKLLANETQVNTDIPELFKIPSDPPRKGQTLCIQLDSLVLLDESVKCFYEKRGALFCLQKQHQTCRRLNVGSIPSNMNRWLQPTITIQSESAEIVELGRKIKGNNNDCCTIIELANNYVFRNIKKRNIATFSSALETLKAGFGDCGEHAVLLAAILRSCKIPARVVLGLVYMENKKGYYYHAWVLAYAGEWYFVDPALGEFPAPDRRIPLVIDDTGQNAIMMAKLLGKIVVTHIDN